MKINFQLEITNELSKLKKKKTNFVELIKYVDFTSNIDRKPCVESQQLSLTSN